MIIFACVDESRYAESVCDHAAWLATELNATIEVLHITERIRRPSSSGDLSGRLGINQTDHLLTELVEIDSKRNRIAQQHGRNMLEAAAIRIKSHGVSKVTQRLGHGELLDHVRIHTTDTAIIVVGKQGEKAQESPAHLGRNLERVIRSGNHPVLITPERFEPIDSYLFAYDAGKSSGAIISLLIESKLLQSLNGTMLMVGKQENDQESHLRDAIQRLRSSHFVIDELVVSGEPVDVILDTLVGRQASLLVMGAYGHSKIRSKVVGSTTTKVMLGCDKPVLVVH